MILRLIIAIAYFALISVPVHAQRTLVTNGHTYTTSCNNNGHVLSSEQKITRVEGSGAKRTFVAEIEKIYLGTSCDAFHSRFGAGSWCWANAGTFVEINQSQIDFVGQELFCDIPSVENSSLDCRC